MASSYCKWCDSDEKHDRRVCACRHRWNDQKFREGHAKAMVRPDVRAAKSRAEKKKWSDPAYRALFHKMKAPRYETLFALSNPSDGRVHNYLKAMAEGMSASEAGVEFGTTRNAVLGCVHRFSQSIARERAGTWHHDITTHTTTRAD